MDIHNYIYMYKYMNVHKIDKSDVYTTTHTQIHIKMHEYTVQEHDVHIHILYINTCTNITRYIVQE